MKANLVNWKDKMQKEPLYGCFVTFGLPDIAEYTASLGFDFIIIDNEHGVMEQTTICNMIRASQCEGVPAVVRCTSNNYDHVQKALDMGANGILVSLVNTVEDAKKLVKLSHYAPEGERGTAYLPRASAYGLVKDKREYLREANKTKFVGAQIETVTALQNLDEILKVEGIDVFFIGPGDLSTSMGLSTNDLKLQETIEKTIKKITAAGKIAGTYVGDVASTKQAVEWGAKFLLTAITPYMTVGAIRYLNEVRNDNKEERGKEIY